MSSSGGRLRQLRARPTRSADTDPGGASDPERFDRSSRSSAATTRTTSSGSTSTSRPRLERQRRPSAVGSSAASSRADVPGLEDTAGARDELLHAQFRVAEELLAARLEGDAAFVQRDRVLERLTAGLERRDRPLELGEGVVEAQGSIAGSVGRRPPSVLIVGLGPCGRDAGRGAYQGRIADHGDDAPRWQGRRSPRRGRSPAGRQRGSAVAGARPWRRGGATFDPGGASAGSRTIEPSARATDDRVAALQGRLRAEDAERGAGAPSDARAVVSRRATSGSMTSARASRTRSAATGPAASAPAGDRADRRPGAPGQRSRVARVARSSSSPTRSRAIASWAAGLSRSRARRSASELAPRPPDRRVGRADPGAARRNARGQELGPIGHDDLGRGRRRRGPDVGGEVRQA